MNQTMKINQDNLKALNKLSLAFLGGAHFRSIGVMLMTPYRSNETRKITADIKQAKEENSELDAFIVKYADNSRFNFWTEIPF